jgi:hypothetical protein
VLGDASEEEVAGSADAEGLEVSSGFVCARRTESRPVSYSVRLSAHEARDSVKRTFLSDSFFLLAVEFIQ